MTTYSEGDEVWVREWDGHRVPAVVQSQKMASVIVLVGDNRKRRAYDRSRVSPRNPERKPTTGTITRPFSHSQPEGMREQPKETCWRSKAYLAHARETGREWGCPGCGSTEQIEASHHGSDGGMGLKASDCFAIGECHECHRETHWSGCYPGRTAKMTRGAILERQVRTMAAWIRKGASRG